MTTRKAPGDPALRAYSYSLTNAQRQRLRVALKNLRRTYGTWRLLGHAMEVSFHALRGIADGRDFGSMAIAIKAASLAGVPVTHLLEGDPVEAGICPTCRQLLGR